MSTVIYLVYQSSVEYETYPFPVRGFIKKDAAQKYAERIGTLYQKLYRFYDDKAGYVSYDEIMAMPEIEWGIYDTYQTKKNRYYGLNFTVEELPFTL